MRSLPLWSASAALVLAFACDGSPPAGTDAQVPDGGPDAGPAVDCSGRPADAPNPRGEVGGAYDAARGRVLIYGGNTAAPEMCMPRYEHTDELWAFHLDCASWEQLSAAGGPGVRTRVAVTTDTMRGRMIVFGGRDRVGFGEYENYNDVWAFDFATDTWTEIATTGSAPPPRSSAAIAYDAARDRVILFGGNDSTSGLSLNGVADTWQLDLSTGAWTELFPAESPSGRLYHGGTVVGTDFVIYGGTPDFDGPFLGDAWAFDMSADTWRLVHEGFADPAPLARFGGEIFADPARGRVVLVGGHDATDMGNRNDTWALDLAGATWSEVHAGDTLNGAPSGPCMFPADFTLPDLASPERRYAFVHAEAEGIAYIFGGKTDCGNVNDVWRLDLASGEWTSLRPATGGESCERSGRAGCSTLCF